LGSRVVVVERDLIHSKAFLSLKVRYAPQALCIFLGKRQIAKQGKKGKERPVILNQGKIEFTFLEAEKKYGWSKKQFAAILRELLEKGFIDIAHHGGVRKRDKTLFSLSERWKDYEKASFVEKEWPEDRVQRGYRKPRSTVSSTSNSVTHTHVPFGYPKTPSGRCLG